MSYLVIDDVKFNYNFNKDNYFEKYLIPIIQDINNAFFSDNIIYTFDFSSKLIDNKDFFDALVSLDNHTMKTYILRFFDKIIDVASFAAHQNLNLGLETDSYKYDEKCFKGNSCSVAEIIYENEFPLLSPQNYDKDILYIDIKKNENLKQVYCMNNFVGYSIYKCLKDENEFCNFVTKVLGFLCLKNFEIERVSDINERDMLKILLSLVNSKNIIKSFDVINAPRIGDGRIIEKFEGDIWEFKVALSASTFRIYYKKVENNVVFFFGLQKKKDKVDRHIREKIGFRAKQV